MKSLSLPPEDKELEELEACDEVLLYGEALTMRDAALRRLAAVVEAGDEPPFEVEGQLVFHAGPAPPAAGRPAGAIGPTTSARMDGFLALLFELGAIGTLGKGPRSRQAAVLHAEYSTVYLSAVGGIGALLGTRVERIEPVAWEDLGAEAVFRVTFSGFPAVVAIDSRGRDCLKERFEAHGQEQA